jgi:hypothetical protein
MGLPSLGLVFDAAVRSYDYADRRYDLIGTRAAALIGFTALLVTGAATVVQRLSPYPGLRLTAVLVFLSQIGWLVYHAVQAYRARDVKGPPDPAVLYQTYAAHPEGHFRSEMIARLGTARESYIAACEPPERFSTWESVGDRNRARHTLRVLDALGINSLTEFPCLEALCLLRGIALAPVRFEGPRIPDATVDFRAAWTAITTWRDSLLREVHPIAVP